MVGGIKTINNVFFNPTPLAGPPLKQVRNTQSEGGTNKNPLVTMWQPPKQGSNKEDKNKTIILYEEIL